MKPKLQPTEKPPIGFKKNLLFLETKSRRVQLLMQPSLYKKIKAKADAEELSVNEFLHALLKGALE